MELIGFYSSGFKSLERPLLPVIAKIVDGIAHAEPFERPHAAHAVDVHDDAAEVE